MCIIHWSFLRQVLYPSLHVIKGLTYFLTSDLACLYLFDFLMQYFHLCSLYLSLELSLPVSNPIFTYINGPYIFICACSALNISSSLTTMCYVTCHLHSVYCTFIFAVCIVHRCCLAPPDALGWLPVCISSRLAQTTRIQPSLYIVWYVAYLLQLG